MNPAEHSARDEAERLGVIVGSDVDRVEDALLAELVRPLRIGDTLYLGDWEVRR